jgi:hypothetical protein
MALSWLPTLPLPSLQRFLLSSLYPSSQLDGTLLGSDMIRYGYDKDSSSSALSQYWETLCHLTLFSHLSLFQDLSSDEDGFFKRRITIENKSCGNRDRFKIQLYLLVWHYAKCFFSFQVSGSFSQSWSKS